MSAIDRISVIAARKNNIIRLKFDAESCDLSADAPEFGSGEESVQAVLDGTPIEIAFNVKYLSEGLRAIASTDVQIQLNEPTMPAILSPVSGQDFTYLIMPIQIRN
jgi:DNA polymerase-3 subunit beta